MTVINAAEWAPTTPPGGHLMSNPFRGDHPKTERAEVGWSRPGLAAIAGDAS